MQGVELEINGEDENMAATDDIRNIIGPAVRAYRTILGKSQPEFAEFLDISMSTYRSLEKHGVASEDTLSLLEAGMGCTIDALIEWYINTSQFVLGEKNAS